MPGGCLFLDNKQRGLGWCFSNCTYREDVRDAYLFNSLDETRSITFDWLEEYNSIRPHAALRNKTPYEFSSNPESVYL